jgi:hypothetical protein
MHVAAAFTPPVGMCDAVKVLVVILGTCAILVVVDVVDGGGDCCALEPQRSPKTSQ